MQRYELFPYPPKKKEIIFINAKLLIEKSHFFKLL